MVARGRLGLGAAGKDRASTLLGTKHGRESRRRLVLARHVRPYSAPARVAGVRQPRRGVGVCPLAQRAAPDGSGVSARSVWIAGGRTRIPMGIVGAIARQRCLRLFELASPPCRFASDRSELV